MEYDCQNQNCIHCYLNVHQSADLDRQVLALPCLFCSFHLFLTEWHLTNIMKTEINEINKEGYKGEMG